MEFARNEIGRFFASHSKYVVCFNKSFGWKSVYVGLLCLCGFI